MKNLSSKSKHSGKNYKTLEEFTEALSQALGESLISAKKKVDQQEVTPKQRVFQISMK